MAIQYAINIFSSSSNTRLHNDENFSSMFSNKMSAIDYLLKPLQEEKLTAAIKKASAKQAPTSLELLPALKQNLQPNNSKKIVVPLASGFEVLNTNNIFYFKAEHSYTNIFCDTLKSSC